MRRMQSGAWLVAGYLCALGVVDCKQAGKRGPQEQTEPEDGDGPFTLDVATEAATQRICQRFISCEDEWGPVFPSMAACLELGPLLWPIDIPTEVLEVNYLDESALHACLVAMLGAGCDRAFEENEVDGCFNEALVGRVPVGACCDARGGCVEDSSCTLSSSSGIGLCRPELPPVGEDESCMDNTPCIPGLYCDRLGDQTCQPLPTIAEACVNNDDGPPCAGGLFCDFYGDRTCHLPVGLSEPCQTFGVPCVGGLYCAVTCLPLLGEGDPCTDPFQSEECAEDLYCDFDSDVCELLPVAGEDCAWGARECAAELVCRDSSHTCQDPNVALLVGDTCQYDTACPRGADCVDSVCSAHAPVGEDCDPTGISAPRCAGAFAMAFGLVCDEGTCQMAPTLSEPCVGACAPLAELYCDDEICQPRLALWSDCDPAGDACLLDATCDVFLEVCLPPPDYVDGGQRCPEQ